MPFFTEQNVEKIKYCAKKRNPQKNNLKSQEPAMICIRIFTLCIIKPPSGGRSDANVLKSW